MIDERFAPVAFAQLTPDSPEVERLCRELGAEIAAEMHLVIETAFRRVADKLLHMGHDMPEDPPSFDPEFNSWQYAYRRGESEEWERFRLRIHFDTQVCVFFPGYNGVDRGEGEPGQGETKKRAAPGAAADRPHE